MSPLVRRGRRGANRGVKPQYDRLKVLGVGSLLGFVWGTLLWGITTAAGQASGAAGWAYFAITCAMIGGGIGGIFAAGQAKRRGERATPKVRLPFRRQP